MTTTMKISIETYANLTNRTFEDVVNECINGNQLIIENIQKLMFCVS
jgi:hypothetical protein